MKAFKLFRVRKNGTLGSLFINRRQMIPLNEWLQAEPHKTKGFAFRPGWHVTERPFAPHLSMKNRCWYEVAVEDTTEFIRPESQGGKWFVAQKMKVIQKV